MKYFLMNFWFSFGYSLIIPYAFAQMWNSTDLWRETYALPSKQQSSTQRFFYVCTRFFESNIEVNLYKFIQILISLTSGVKLELFLPLKRMTQFDFIWLFYNNHEKYLICIWKGLNLWKSILYKTNGWKSSLSLRVLSWNVDKSTENRRKTTYLFILAKVNSKGKLHVCSVCL